VNDRSTPLKYHSGQMRLIVWFLIFTYNLTKAVIVIIDILLEISKTTGHLLTDTDLDVLTTGSLKQTISGQHKPIPDETKKVNLFNCC
jgi:hypothetical protein